MAINVLFRRNSLASKLYRWCTISLFALATIYVGTNVWGYTRQATIYFEATKTRSYDPLLRYLHGDVGKSALFGTVSLNVAFMNIIADWMLIHRCYVIWESNKVALYSFSSIAIILNGLNAGTYIVGIVGIVSTSSVAKYRLFHWASEINNGCNVAIAVFSLILTFTTGTFTDSDREFWYC
ncbi:hypothetical protein PM082_011194 [Marasmius tenuissimus]|nr:hypothetical protein PM082_011194 [Marasmius tenuissimus]